MKKDRTAANVVKFRKPELATNESREFGREAIENAVVDLEFGLSQLSAKSRPKEKLALAARLVDEAAREIARAKPAQDVVQLMLISTCLESEKMRYIGDF